MFQVFLSQQSIVTGKPLKPIDSPSIDSKSRESRQILFQYHYPWPGHGHPVHYYDNSGQFDYGYFGPYYQERRKQESLVDLLSTEAVQWMRNLNQDEQERLTAWTLASVAVASLTERNVAGTVPFSPVVSPQNHFSDYGQQRTASFPSSIPGQLEDSEARTFRLIQQVVRRVAAAIRNCQVGGVFFPLIRRCRQPTTTTASPSTTITVNTLQLPTTTLPSLAITLPSSTTTLPPPTTTLPQPTTTLPPPTTTPS